MATHYSFDYLEVRPEKQGLWWKCDILQGLLQAWVESARHRDAKILGGHIWPYMMHDLSQEPKAAG